MTTKDAETKLRHTFRAMDADQAQEIREAYYKTVEGLYALEQSLRVAAANNQTLLSEHRIARSAIDAMNKSILGRIL